MSDDAGKGFREGLRKEEGKFISRRRFLTGLLAVGVTGRLASGQDVGVGTDTVAAVPGPQNCDNLNTCNGVNQCTTNTCGGNTCSQNLCGTNSCTANACSFNQCSESNTNTCATSSNTCTTNKCMTTNTCKWNSCQTFNGCKTNECGVSNTCTTTNNCTTKNNCPIEACGTNTACAPPADKTVWPQPPQPWPTVMSEALRPLNWAELAAAFAVAGGQFA